MVELRVAQSPLKLCRTDGKSETVRAAGEEGRLSKGIDIQDAGNPRRHVGYLVYMSTEVLFPCSNVTF